MASLKPDPPPPRSLKPVHSPCCAFLLHIHTVAFFCAFRWHAHKFVDPAESGAVLPILHANGFKISNRTIPGTMDDKEAVALFTGYVKPSLLPPPDRSAPLIMMVPSKRDTKS
jgi:hypothetical protein